MRHRRTRRTRPTLLLPTLLLPAIVLAATAVISATSASAAAGDLDAGFGGPALPGVVQGLPSMRGFAVQSDGRILVAGSNSLQRLLANGQPDASFAAPVAIVTLGIRDDVALDSAGRVLVPLARLNRIAVARLLPDGTADPTFGTGGVTSFIPTNVPNGFQTGGAQRLVVRPDGAVIAITPYVNSTLEGRVAIVRFLPDGTPDPAFNNGILSVLTDSIVGATILTDGKLLAQTGFSWVRLLATGMPDAAFGPNGIRDAGLPAGFTLHRTVMRPDGSVIVAGSPGVLRLTPSLTIDPTFAGGTGIALYPTPAVSAIQGGVAADVGTIVVATSPAAGIVRFTSSGQLDTTFGEGGFVADPLGLGFQHVAITPAGIVGGGSTYLVRLIARSTFKLTLTPNTVTIGGGESAPITAAIIREPGFTAPVSISFIVSQPGISVPPTVVLIGANLSTTATIGVDATVPAGTYQLRVRAFSSGHPPQERIVSVVVPSCRLALSVTSVSLAPGGAAQNVGLALARSASCQGPATFTITGLPAGNPPLGSGIGNSFTPNPTTGSTSTLRLHALRFALPDDSLMTVVRATVGSTVVSANLSIEVVDLH